MFPTSRSPLRKIRFSAILCLVTAVVADREMAQSVGINTNRVFLLAFTLGVFLAALGGALAAILVGPYTGALCIAIVLVVQALLFADGGLTALGTNITNMALIGVAVGYTAERSILRRLNLRDLH